MCEAYEEIKSKNMPPGSMSKYKELIVMENGNLTKIADPVDVRAGHVPRPWSLCVSRKTFARNAEAEVARPAERERPWVMRKEGGHRKNRVTEKNEDWSRIGRHGGEIRGIRTHLWPISPPSVILVL